MFGGLGALLCWVTPAVALTNQSSWAYPGADGRLVYRRTPLGDRILDYSALGFRQGAEPIPKVPVRETLSPQPGDDGGAIQAALNRVGALPPDANGFRGAVLLTAGHYEMTNTLLITMSGVVLRGAGPEATTIQLNSTNQAGLLTISGTDGWYETAGASWPIADKYVPVGARSLHVQDPAGLAVHDRVMVHRPATTNWLHDIGMDAVGWLPGKEDIFYDRTITRLEGSLVTLDAPLANSLDQRYGGGRLFKYSWLGRIRNVGVEDLCAASGFDPSILATNTASLNFGMVYYADINHPQRFVFINLAEDVWVQNVTSRHFINGFTQVEKRTRSITVRGCRNVEPVAPLLGGLRYSFDNLGQLVLIQDCHDDHGRHPYANLSTSAGPAAFVDCVATNCYAECSPRHHWTTGAMYDNVFNLGPDGIHVRNWGSLWGGRGFTGANCALWNCLGGYFVVNNPPTAQNWLIGARGVIGLGSPDVGSNEPGLYDAIGIQVRPRSLYHAQRQQRLSFSRLEPREYPLGDFDLFEPGDPADEPPVDGAWRLAIANASPHVPVAGFDSQASPQIIALSFNVPLAPGERVVGAALGFGLKASGVATAGDWVWLDDASHETPFGDLGWLPLTTNDTRILDLSPHLALLQDGQLHVAVGTQTAVDWAVLNLEIAHEAAPVVLRHPEADATVQDGEAASWNFGADATLGTGWSATRRQETFVRFDLSGLSPTLTRARVRFFPLAATGPAEDGAFLVRDGAWNENTLTWDTKPAACLHLGDWAPAAGEPVDIDVTHAVQEALAGNGRLSLRIAATRDLPGTGVAYGARETGNPGTMPTLVILSEVPSLSPVASITAPANAALGPVAFSVDDLETPASNVVITAHSSDPAWLPPQNLALGGSGSHRTLLLLPVSNRNDSATITLVATDTDGAAATNHFEVLFTAATNVTLSQYTRLDPLAKGQTALCHLRVANCTPQTAAHLVLSNPLPAEVAFVSAVPSQGACACDGTTVRCDLGDLGPGAAARVLLTYAPQASGRITNVISLHQATFDFDPANHVARAVLEVQADSDGDGMPNTYEIAHGLNPHSAADRHADADGDGAGNFEEYQAGTAPGDAASVMSLTALRRDAHTVELSFPTTPGRIFHLEWNPQFPSAPWQPFGDPVPGTGGRVVLSLGLQPEPGFNVYRLTVQP